MNTKQWLGVVGAVLSALVTATALFTQLFGPTVAQYVIAGLSLANLILQSVSAQLSTQGNLVKDVAAMPGVEKVVVNQQATPALAAVATDSSQPKVGAVDVGTQVVLKDIAKGA